MSKTFHILNGDALVEFFPEILPGEIIVARECLVDGPLSGATLPEFWAVRAAFIASEYQEEESLYFEDIVPEFEKIRSLPADAEVNLWFEEDLFCQVNMWFCISLFAAFSNEMKIYLVKPPLLNNEPDWRGFAAMDNLAGAYEQRQQLSASEVQLLVKIWSAYTNKDYSALTVLGNSATANFPFLKQIILAETERFPENGEPGRPEIVLKQIMTDKNTTDPEIVFREFSRREGIYGFGDWQIESLMRRMNATKQI